MSAHRGEVSPSAAGVHVAPPDPGGRPQPRRYTLIGPDRRPYGSDSPGALGGHRGTRIYGSLDCPSARRSIARGGYVTHRVFFASEATAVAAGYRPCAVCRPGKYRTWKAAREARRLIDALNPLG